MSSREKRKQREEEEEKTPPHTEHETHAKEYDQRGKREREEYEQQRQVAEEKLERAKKELKEAEEKRDAAESKRDSYLDKYIVALEAKNPELCTTFKKVWEDAEMALQNAEATLTTARTAIETQQNAVNRFTELALPPSPGSSRSGGSSAGKRQKIEGVLKSQCFKDDLLDFTLKTDEGQQTWEVPAALLDLLKDVDPNFLPSGGKVFIREPMKQMLECLKEHSSMQYIEGSPGVGKSLLLFLFAVHRFVEKNESCLFVRRIRDETRGFYVLMEDGRLVLYRNVPDNIERDRIHEKGGKYYVDGVNPKDPYLKSLGEESDFWVTSASHNPKDESDSEVLYLSAWTEDEIKNGFKALGYPESQAELHYSVIGGSFRHVGEDEESLRSRMRNACKGGEIVRTDRLFHTFVTHPRYSRGYERREASEFVVDVLRAADVQSLLKVYRKIDSPSVKGGIFQVITEKWMEKACTRSTATVVLHCYNFTTEEEDVDVRLEFGKVAYPNGRSASRKHEIKGEEGVMYCPTLCNFPGCDKLLFCNNELLLINDTVGNHKCDWSTFGAAFECMRQNPVVQECPTKVIYLVPSRFDRDAFTLTSFVGKRQFEDNNVQVCVGYCESIAEFVR